MGKTFSTGLLTNGIWQDASNNIGIGGSPSGSYKLEVTGTAKVSSTLLLGGALTGTSATFSGAGVDVFSSSGIGTSAVSGLFRVVTAGTSSGIAIGQSNSTRYTSISANDYKIYNDDFFLTTNGAFPLSIGTNNTARLTIASTGAATFSSTITAAALSKIGDVYIGGRAGTYASYPDGIFGDNLHIGATGTGGGVYVNAALSRTVYINPIGGNVLIGSTDAAINSGVGIKLLNDTSRHISSVSSYTLNTEGEAFIMYSTGAGNYRFYVGWGGQIYATSTTISGISDMRLKENIRDINCGLKEIMLLKPREFDWKEGKGKNIKNDRGFIAQEFEEIFPDLIDISKDEVEEGESPYKSIRQDLIPVLVKAIQEMNQQNQDLKSRLDKAGL